MNHLNAIQDAVNKLEEIVNNLENELKRREADLKVMKLMAAQCTNHDLRKFDSPVK